MYDCKYRLLHTVAHNISFQEHHGSSRGTLHWLQEILSSFAADLSFTTKLLLFV